MQGALSFALSNKSLTRLAPTPTNNSTNSEAAIDRKGTPDSPAIAFANNVLPVPGGPIKRTPFGIFAPKSFNFCGFFRKFLSFLLILRQPLALLQHPQILYQHLQ